MTAPRLSPASVLLAFRAENVRSFKDEIYLSLVATNLAEESVVRTIPLRGGGKPIKVLPVAGVFGANGSGKTNLLRAMNDMREHVLHSFRLGRPHGGVPRRPFLLAPSSRGGPSLLEVEIVLEGVRYSYGFTCDDDQFLSEWAYWYPHGRRALMFMREKQDVDLRTDRAKGRAVRDLMRPNALFLSTAASANHPSLSPLYSWFERNLILAEAKTRPFRQALTTQMLDEELGNRENVMALLRAADLGVSGAVRRKFDPETEERVRKAVGILLGEEGSEDSLTEFNLEEAGARLLHDSEEGPIDFDPDDESLGTLVWFGLIGPVVEALSRGTVFLADELDASLHPSLVGQLVRLFQDSGSNPRRAQLIFNSHDSTLLGDSGSRPIGRDQIWFAEKVSDGSSTLYPLSDLDVRKSEAVARRYLAGRYGGRPILSVQEFDEAAKSISSNRAE